MNIYYSNRPSRAILVDEERWQYVIIKTRSGMMVPSYGISIAQQVLDDLENLQNEVNPHHQDLKYDFQYLMLRGVWLDDSHGGAVLYVELIHNNKDQPRLTEDQIKRALHNDTAWYEGQMIFVEVKIRETFIYSDYFSSVLDEHYDELEKSSYISSDVSANLISAIISKLSPDTLPVAKLQLEALGVNDIEQLFQNIEEGKQELQNGIEASIQNKSSEFSIEFIEGASENLEKIRQERFRQATLSFTTALVLSGIGVVVIILGIIFLFLGQIPVGAITAAAGVIPEVISILIFRFNRETNDRLDKIIQQLNLLENVKISLNIALQLSNIDDRDNTIKKLIESLRQT